MIRGFPPTRTWPQRHKLTFLLVESLQIMDLDHSKDEAPADTTSDENPRNFGDSSDVGVVESSNGKTSGGEAEAEGGSGEQSAENVANHGARNDPAKDGPLTCWNCGKVGLRAHWLAFPHSSPPLTETHGRRATKDASVLSPRTPMPRCPNAASAIAIATARKIRGRHLRNEAPLSLRVARSVAATPAAR